MPYMHKAMPDVCILGSETHRNAVMNLYRHTLKWAKYLYKFDYNEWDWFAYNCRKEFEKCRQMKDPGEVNKLMKECEAMLLIKKDPEYFRFGWDGPQSVNFNKYPTGIPKRIFEHRVGSSKYDPWWTTRTLDEHFGKKEIEKWIARHVVAFREQSFFCDDYVEWLALKKRMEEQLKVKVDDIKRTIGVDNWSFYMDYPYNPINEFSDGWSPNLSLDQAFQDHWDEELWYKVAELTPDEQEAVRNHNWQDHSSLRTIDRLLPGGKRRSIPSA